jgi:hypothetical protein
MYASNCLNGFVEGLLAIENSTGHVDTVSITDDATFSNIHYAILAKGTYTAYIANQWTSGHVKDYTFRLYA